MEGPARSSGPFTTPDSRGELLRLTSAQHLVACLGEGAAIALAPALLQLDADQWLALAREAVAQELEGLLQCRLTRAPQLPAASDAALRVLEERAAIHGLRTQLLEQQLREILAALAACHIDAILLKGACLAWCVYPHPSLRSMGDLDLLVRERDLPAARAALEALGYHADNGPVAHHLPALRRPGALSVELHWTLELPESPFTVDLAGAWQRARPARVLGQPALVLAPTDLLVHLSVHAAWHHRFGIDDERGIDLKHIYDIAAVVSKYSDLDLELLVRTARDWGAMRYLYVILGVVRRLFHVALPIPLTGSMPHSATDDRLIGVIADSLLAPAPLHAVGYTTVNHAPDPRTRIAYALASLFPGRREIARIYGLEPGSVRTAVMSLIRPLLLAARYLRITAAIRADTPEGRAIARRGALRREVGRWLDSAPRT